MAIPDSIVLSCSKCKKVKPLDGFRLRPERSATGKRLGRQSKCMDCEREYRLSPHNRRLATARMKAFRDRLLTNDPERLRERDRKGNLKRLYGISVEEFDAMLATQGGACAICGETQAGGRWKRRFHVDHHHGTGAIRGLLCNGCNVGIGSFREDPEVMQKAIEYLRKHNGS
jgi:hypothetical protein